MGSSESEERSMENVVSNQGTFSKRRTSFVRKAHEMSLSCDVDVGVVAFCPSGRLHKFFSGEKLMEDLIERYIKLPSEKRYQHLSCLEWKLRRAREYDQIRGDENKLFHLENQIKNMELQIKKTIIEVEISRTNLKVYELENEEDAPLTRILFCEKNLHQTLQEIKDRKERLVNDKHPSTEQTRPQVMQRSVDRETPFASNSSLLMQRDLRTFPYSSKVTNGRLEQLYRRRRISLGLNAASNNFGFIPLAPNPIYHQGTPYLTRQATIQPAYPPIQTQPAGIENLQFGYGNSSIHQRVLGDPAIPYVPYQSQPLGTSNLNHQPIMPGIKDQQLRLGGLGSSFANQFLMENGSMPSNVQSQPQQHGVLSSTSVGEMANNEPSQGQGNHMPTSNQKNNNPQNVIQVDPNQILCNPNFNTVVTSPLNSVSASNNPANGDGDGVNNGNLANSSTDSNNTIVNNDTNVKENNYEEPESPNTTFFNSLLAEAVKEAGTTINNTIANTDTNEPQPESPDTIFFNSLLNEHAMKACTSENAVNKEETNPVELEDFVLPDNISLEDFDFLF